MTPSMGPILDLLGRAFPAMATLLGLAVVVAGWGYAASVGDIPVGWATLLGPVLGGLIAGAGIAWQTSAGFRHLIAAQRDQSELDRMARRDQAEIDRQHEEDKLRLEAETLCAALRGELLSTVDALFRAQQTTQISKAVIDTSGAPQTRYSVGGPPRLDCLAYAGNAHRVGLLGVSVAMDVTLLYSTLLAFNKVESTQYDRVTAGKLADMWLEVLRNTREDTFLVLERLKVFEEGGEPVESLFEFRRKREAAERTTKKKEPNG
jgi:threonine dehydrogenase-like Zn-dependent dehydrogenase